MPGAGGVQSAEGAGPAVAGCAGGYPDEKYHTNGEFTRTVTDSGTISNASAGVMQLRRVTGNWASGSHTACLLIGLIQGQSGSPGVLVILLLIRRLISGVAYPVASACDPLRLPAAKGISVISLALPSERLNT